jgi:hypothetical protein
VALDEKAFSHTWGLDQKKKKFVVILNQLLTNILNGSLKLFHPGRA